MSESQTSNSQLSPNVPDSNPDPDAASRKLAFDTVMAQMTAQDRTLTNLRNRATGLFSIASFVIALSSTLGLVGAGGDKFPLWAAITLLAIFFVQGLLIMAVLWPVYFHFGPDPIQMLDPPISHTGEAPSEAMVGDLIHWSGENVHKLHVRSLMYAVSVLLLLTEVAILVAAIIAVRSFQ
ncbi:hypothetical protein [Streptomyces sp. NPDC058621]|uniref:hypothetical protein n=1 Tax=Streptomyces sp. NPDC058621 TaxID=3346561 RepID=UPI00365E258D